MSNKKTYRKYAVTTMAAAAAVASVAPVAISADTTKGFSDLKSNHEFYNEILELTDRNVITGFEDGTFKPESDIKRLQVARILFKELDLSVPEDIAGTLERYTNVTENSEDADIIAAVTKAGIFGQFESGSGEFNSWDPISREHMAAALVRAYDLGQYDADKVDINLKGVDTSFTEDVQILANLGITKGAALENFNPRKSITRGQFVGQVHRAFSVVETPEEVVAGVESVSAINASELQVTFNAAVDADTADKPANYNLKINDVDVSSEDIIDIAVSEDGKTATLLLDQSELAFQNGDKYVLQTNDAILSKDGKKLEKFVSEEATFSETAAPSLVKVDKSKNDDKLTLTFDRPVNAALTDEDDDPADVTLVKIDDITIDSNDLKPVEAKEGNADVLGEAGNYNYTIDIENETAKTESKKIGTHEVVIFDVKDTAAAYPANASVLVGSYTITDEVTAPEVVGIEAVNANRFFVYTNVGVDLDGAKVIVNKGSHEFPSSEGNFASTVQTDEKTRSAATIGIHNGKPGIWVTVTDNKDNKDKDETPEDNPLYRTGETSVDLTVTVEKYKAHGLIGKKATENVTLNKSDTKPEVKSTVLKPQEDGVADELVVTFTNKLVNLDGTDLTALESSDFVVRDNDGVIVTGFNAKVEDEVVTFTKENEDLKGAPYTVEFKEGKFKNEEELSVVADYLANTVKNDAFTVSVGEKAASNFKYSEFAFDKDVEEGTVENARDYKVVQKNDENSITFKYDGKMSDSARDVKNYTLDGKALPAGTTIDFINDRQTVKIVFPKETFKTDTQYKLGITDKVKTETGSIIVGSLQTKAPAELVFGVKDNVQPELTSAIYYVDDYDVTSETKTNRIEVTFNEAVTGVDSEEDFAVVINGSRFNVGSVAQAETGENKDRKLVLTLADDEDKVNISQSATITIVPESEKDDETVVKDTAGNKAKDGSTVTLTGGDYKVVPTTPSEAEDLASDLGENTEVDGNTVSLTDDVNVSDNLTIPAGVTLNTNGKKINNTGTIKVDGILVITDTNELGGSAAYTIGKDGALKLGEDNYIAKENAIVLIDGDVDVSSNGANGYTFDIPTGTTAKIAGSNSSGDYYHNGANDVINVTGKLEINKRFANHGTINVENDGELILNENIFAASSNTTGTFKFVTDAQLTLSGGSIEGTNPPAAGKPNANFTWNGTAWVQ